MGYVEKIRRQNYTEQARAKIIEDGVDYSISQGGIMADVVNSNINKQGGIDYEQQNQI